MVWTNVSMPQWYFPGGSTLQCTGILLSWISVKQTWFCALHCLSVYWCTAVAAEHRAIVRWLCMHRSMPVTSRWVSVAAQQLYWVFSGCRVRSSRCISTDAKTSSTISVLIPVIVAGRIWCWPAASCCEGSSQKVRLLFLLPGHFLYYLCLCLCNSVRLCVNFPLCKLFVMFPLWYIMLLVFLWYVLHYI